MRKPGPVRYRHALCLYPYVVDQRPGIGVFPPTGLEYVATALKGHVKRISLVVLAVMIIAGLLLYAWETRRTTQD